MDIVFGHQGVGGCQIEEIVISCFCALQLVFRVLGLSLEKNKKEESPIMRNVFLMRSENVIQHQRLFYATSCNI